MIALAKAGIRRLLPKNHFARGVSVLVGGTAGSQVLLVLASPLLTRLYGPDDFGLLAVYASLLAIIGVVSSLRYELAIPLPEDDVEAANVAALSLLLVITTAVLTGVVVLLLSGPISAALGVPALGPYLWLLPIGVLVAGAYKVFNYWAVRTKRFSTIAGTKLRQAIATIGIQLVGFKLGSVALLLGQVAGQGVGTTTLGVSAIRSTGFRGIHWRGIKWIAWRYRRFPIYSSWAGGANTASAELPPTLIAALFTPAAAGLYALAHRVLTLPMSLIGQSIGQVFFANAAEARRNGELGSLVASVHTKLAHVGFPPALVLVLLGPNLFTFVFGEQWRQAGEFARWMAPWLYLQFVSSPISTVFSVTDNQKKALAFQIILLVSRIAAMVLGAWYGDLNLTIMLFAGASAFCYLGFLVWVARIVGNPVRTMWQPTLAAFAFASAATLPILVGLSMPAYTPMAWAITLSITALLIVTRYWFLLRKAY